MELRYRADMSEPIPPPPKPFSAKGYVLLVTFWAFLLPGVTFHIPLALYASFHNVTGGIASAMLIAFGFPLLVVFSLVGLVRFSFFWRRFTANLRVGQVPKSFTLRILPFWIPLFWGLAVTVFCLFSAVTVSLNYYVFGGFWGFPQYFFFYAFAMFANDPESFWILSNITAFLVAITGTDYVLHKAPPVPKRQGLVFCSVMTLLLCGLAGLEYCWLRMTILPPDPYQAVVRDEPRSISRWIDTGDTDLTEYVPFTANNKLVKIESPTLAIDSEHPRIHGAFALYPVYAAAVEATYHNTGGMEFDPNYGTVKSGTSPQAFESLLNGESDMIFMLQPSEKQLQEAKDRRIELVITHIGYEAFVFFVSMVNPVDDLTLEQIRDIYSKRTTRWNNLGGKNERILPFQRPEGSGSQTAMFRVMGDVPMAPPLQEEFREGMGGIVASVADYRNYGNAIGFSFRYYVEGLFKHDGVKLLKINGVAPTMENIQNGSYPLIGELVIISRSDNVNPNVQKLTEWFLSPQGQQLVENVGYVPLQTRNEK